MVLEKCQVTRPHDQDRCESLYNHTFEDDDKEALLKVINILSNENTTLKEHIKTLSCNQHSCKYADVSTSPENIAVGSKNRRCQFCGISHIWGKDRCSAYGHRCKVCLKHGHFEMVCFHRKKSIKKSRSLPTLKTSPALQNQENFVFTDTSFNSVETIS